MTMHPTHVTRFSWDASTYDVVCVNCGNTDRVPGGWGELSEPCPCVPTEKPVDEMTVTEPVLEGDDHAS